MMLILIFAALLAVSTQAHREPSDLYKSYRSSKVSPAWKNSGKTTRKVVYPSSKDLNMRSKDLFVPPRDGESAVDYHPQLKNPIKDDEPFVYYSWHIHSYFFHEDANVTARAMAIRDQFIADFNLETCSGDCFMGGPFDTCDQGMCVWDPYYSVDGPHPYGQWGVYLPNELVAQTVSWFTANHGEFEILFHPNTGYMVGDHSPDKRAMWIKQQVPLDLDFLVWLQCKWFGCSDQISLAQAVV